MLILDEAHKLRNLYGVPDTPQVAKRFQQALEDRRFRFVLMLTATPIHNRLWDLYSLVDLLTVARGHENPFGSEGMFARRFIADKQEQARRLKEDAKDEFRSIVYGYMSRVRRDDAKLLFPRPASSKCNGSSQRSGELELIEAIAEPIQKLNRLAQIAILQDLDSSPDALLGATAQHGAQRHCAARTGCRREDRSLRASHQREAPWSPRSHRKARSRKSRQVARWSIFTTRRETQTTIQDLP